MLGAGIHDIPSHEYHLDPCEGGASLSNSILKTLLTKSPRHAWLQHPRLNPSYREEHADKFDLGTAAHAYFLEGQDRCVVVDAEDWRTKEAKAQRDAARLVYKTPMLRHQYEEMLLMVGAAHGFIKRHPHLRRIFEAGKSEQTVIWPDEHGVPCRALLDWLTDDRTFIADYKTTSAPNPEAFMRGMTGFGYDTQDAFYRRGLRRLGFDPEFIFLVQEDSPPFSCYVVTTAQSMRSVAESRIERGLYQWAVCTSSGEWPEYEPNEGMYSAEAPAWAVMQEEMLK